MVKVTGYNRETDCASFVASAESDLTKLPTTKKSGTNELKDVDPVVMGSDCLVINKGSGSKVFMLDGEDDKWYEI